MFSPKTKAKVLELNSFFSKYSMSYEDKINKKFTYYDTPNYDLEKSNIVLYKTQIGKLTELNMATDKISSTHKYTIRSHYKHFVLQIKPNDSIFKYKDFLIDKFKDMFMSSVNFDPEFLFQKLQVAYTIETTATEYRSTNVTGLKITYSFDTDIYTNMFNKNKVTSNILTIYQHSPARTNDDFEDLISKLTRYLKELTPTSDTKIQIARKMCSEQAAKNKQLELQEMKRKVDKKKGADKKSKDKNKGKK